MQGIRRAEYGRISSYLTRLDCGVCLPGAGRLFTFMLSGLRCAAALDRTSLDAC